MTKYTAFVLICILIVGGVLVTRSAYAQEWFPGDNAQEGLLVKYRISNFDFKGGSPFDVTLWLNSKDDRGNWITDIIVEDKGQVVTGRLILSSLTLTPLGGDISPELQPYRAPIKDSLAWLDSYASQIEPKSLTGNRVWGVIAAIGGGSITVKPVGAETIQAAGQSWDTSIIGFHYGVDSKVWIKDDFPLPIRARVYTISTQQPIPVQFEFELLETRITDIPPEPPKSELQLPKPPLRSLTTSAIFSVELYWEPITIQTDESTTFTLVIFDQQDRVLKNVRYNLLIEDVKGSTVIDEGFLAEEGQGSHEITFEETGRTHITVTVQGTLGGMPERIIEKAEFEIIVVPEFPLSSIIVMGSIVTIMVMMIRFKRVKMPGL